MKKTVPGIKDSVEIPEGIKCYFSHGGVCALLNRENRVYCEGWGGLELIDEELHKHVKCLALCGIIPESEANFQNPEIPWKYPKPFSLELDPNVSGERIPNLTEVVVKREWDKIILTFTEELAIIFLTAKDVETRSSQYKFYWEYREVIAIRDIQGNLLWENQKHPQLRVLQSHANLSQRLGLDRAPKNSQHA